MSHISKIELEINDLPALIGACESMGFIFAENQKTFKWYRSKPGKCDHAIRIPGAEYEIGVVQDGNGKYSLQCDFYDYRLRKAIGENGGLLKQAYAIERIKREAKLKRYRVQQKKIDNGIRIVLTASA